MEVAIIAVPGKQSTLKKNGAYMWEPNDEIQKKELPNSGAMNNCIKKP